MDIIISQFFFVFPAPRRGAGETVEKVASPLFRVRMHAGQPSISCEKVGLSCARGVISDAHVVGNDGSKPYSATCGWRNSLREGFFDKLSAPAKGGGAVRIPKI